MTIIRHTHTLAPASEGRGISTIPNLLGKQIHFILAPSLSELGKFAQESKLPEKVSANSWDMNLGVKRAIDYCFTGDTSAVAESDALLSRMESYITMPSTRALWEPALAGGFPLIPEFLAGQPLNMRMRVKHQIDSAPLAIMVDLGISAAITAQQVRNRGVAILALVRALSAHRPIELWTLDFGSADDSSSGSYGALSRSNAVCCGCKIETSPLDLSTACYALTHPAFVRQVLFGLEQVHHDFQGGWPFRINRALSRREMEVLLAPMFTHTAETLALPGLHVADQSMTDPASWLKRQLAEHDPLKLEETID